MAEQYSESPRRAPHAIWPACKCTCRSSVAASRALASRPSLVLADEPTGNLDETTADEVVTLMTDLVARSRCSLLMVTHSLRLAGLLGRRVHLTGGRIA